MADCTGALGFLIPRAMIANIESGRREQVSVQEITVLAMALDVDHAAAQLGHSDTSVTKAHYIQKAHTAPDMSDVLEQLGPRQAA